MIVKTAILVINKVTYNAVIFHLILHFLDNYSIVLTKMCSNGCMISYFDEDVF